MDPNRTSGQSSSSAAESMVDPERNSAIVVVGSENPMIIEWEELEQELARLWSLSSALKKAKERKESLSQRLEANIKVREESLLQSNALEDMREKLEAQKLAMGDMTMYMKKALEDVKIQRQQICAAVKTLLVAGKTLSSAQQQLQEANNLLAGERGHGNLKNLQKMVRMRQQYMITQVSTLYPVKALNEPKEKLDSHHCGDLAGTSTSAKVPKSPRSPEMTSLTILGLQLTAVPLKKMSFFGNKAETQKSATVLGYAAHAVILIASYLDVRLRYPLRFGGSRSYVHDHAPSIDSTSDSALNTKSTEFPLFLEGQDTTRAAYAIFLLNKDLEQLLNYMGAESLGPRHVLANLKELMRIILSHNFIDR